MNYFYYYYYMYYYYCSTTTTLATLQSLHFQPSAKQLEGEYNVLDCDVILK